MGKDETARHGGWARRQRSGASANQRRRVRRAVLPPLARHPDPARAPAFGSARRVEACVRAPGTNEGIAHHLLVSSLGVVLSGWIMSIELEADPSSLLLFFLFFFADLSSSDMVLWCVCDGSRGGLLSARGAAAIDELCGLGFGLTQRASRGECFDGSLNPSRIGMTRILLDPISQAFCGVARPRSVGPP